MLWLWVRWTLTIVGGLTLLAGMLVTARGAPRPDDETP